MGCGILSKDPLLKTLRAGRMAQPRALKDPSHANNQSTTPALKVALQRRRWFSAQTKA